MELSQKVVILGNQNDGHCLDRCKEMLRSVGGALTGFDMAMGIYKDTRVVGPCENYYTNGIRYIDEQLERGMPVMVYVDYKNGCSVGSTKQDKAGDHAIIIVGGNQYFGHHFFDPATADLVRGTSNTNRLYLIDGMLQCDNNCTGRGIRHYILSSIRLSK